ncbi:MAG: response regulator [Balneolales bacterium]
MMHILIIEDEFLIASSLDNYLTEFGYEVTSGIGDGLTAVKVVEQNHFNLILMDINLQGSLDGVETMERIRAFSSIPVIYLTGNTDEATRNRAEKTNPISFMNKPVDLEKLCEVIALKGNGKSN